MYPDFIGIGAQKSGTTWLHRNLNVHPQLWLPRKEVHYFDRKINDNSNALTRLFGKSDEHDRWRRQTWQGIRAHTLKAPSLEDLRWIFKYYMRPYNDRWYGEIFEPKKGRVAGEITPAYSVLDSEMVAHVHELVPKAKLIFIMRNPIERAWSQVVMSFDKVEEGSADYVSERKLIRKLKRDSFQRLTNYLRTFENWGAYYPDEQIFVGFLEDIQFFPEKLLGKIYDFLNVDPHFDPSLTEKKIHSRSIGRMPTSVALYLAKSYREEIERLSQHFGGHASFWLYCADRLIESPPETKDVSYPLWDSEMWEEWIAYGGDEDRRPEFQSGPLISVKVEK